METQDSPSFIGDVELFENSIAFTKKSSIDSPAPITCASLLNPMQWKPELTRALDRSHIAVQTIFTIICAFSAYFVTYGIHSAIFAATFSGEKVGTMDLKIAFSISQTISYGVSKVAGAIVIPTITRERRLLVLVILIVTGEIPLILFGVVPPIGQVIMVFLSGIPTAWVWGIMVMYLEGRKTSEFLIMGLYLSVMVATGAAKSIAVSIIRMGVSEAWMPATVGGFAVVIFVVFIYLLDAVPDPTTSDKEERSERRTMSQTEARKFLFKWAPGFIMVTLVYSLLGAYRNFRDYFAPELWADLEGPNFDPANFTKSELTVGICTAAAYSLLYYIKDNKKAFFAILAVMFLGGAVVLIATITETAGLIGDPLTWMILIGVGLFMAYIPPGAMLYDRFNGATGQPYTSVFMIYLSDVSGYGATLAILFYRNFGDAELSWVDFFQKLSFISSILCMAGIFIASIYFFFAMRRNAIPTCVEDGAAADSSEGDDKAAKQESKNSDQEMTAGNLAAKGDSILTVEMAEEEHESDGDALFSEVDVN